MTIKELAKLAKVSPSAVSIALNNKQGISEKTRKMILELADKYGYNKKIIERKRIVFIKYLDNGLAVEKNGDFISEVIDSIEQTASNLGYDLIIKNILSINFVNEIKNIDFSEYAGVIFLGTEATKITAEYFENLIIPVVAVDNIFEDVYIDSVVMDNWGGIKIAVNYLKSLGYKKINYIDSKIKFSNFSHRLDAFKYEMEKQEMKIEKIFNLTPNLEDAYIDMLENLKNIEFKFPTAFIAANDTLAIGAIKAFKEMKIKIPKEISIIGFDDIPFCTILDSPLTTIKVFKEQMGEMALKLLHEKIINPSNEKVKLLSMTKLIERESTLKIK